MSFRYNQVTPFFFQFLSFLPTRFYFLLFGTFEVFGKENLKTINSPNAIFASNHSSEWDPVLLGTTLTTTKFSPLFFVSGTKKSYEMVRNWRNNFYGGWFFKVMGAYPIIKVERNYKEALIHHVELLSLKRNICIYPEGYLNRNGVLEKAKGGVGFLAASTNTPVIPVAITGVGNLTIKTFFSRKNKLVIEFGKPLYYDDLFGEKNNLTIEDYKDGAQIIMDKIKKLTVHENVINARVKLKYE